MPGRNRDAFVGQTVQFALLLDSAEQHKRPGNYRPAKAQLGFTFRAGRHDCQVRITFLHGINHLRKTATARRHLKVQPGAQGHHFEKICYATGKYPAGVKIGTGCQVIIDHQACHRVAFDPAQLLIGQVKRLFAGDETVAADGHIE
ncbi:hypothetical protein D3C84_746610 [compost metagenome]